MGKVLPVFDPWRIPGRKQLVAGPSGLTLGASRGSDRFEVRLGDGVVLGEPFELYARITGTPSEPSDGKLAARWLAGKSSPSTVAAVGRTAILHMRALQALDAVQGGASQREVASAVFGEDEARANWSADGDLRARTRHLLRRADAFMRGGYRTLANLAPLQGDEQAR